METEAESLSRRVRNAIADKEPYSELIPAIIEKCRQFKNWKRAAWSSLSAIENISHQNAKVLISEFCTESIFGH